MPLARIRSKRSHAHGKRQVYPQARCLGGQRIVCMPASVTPAPLVGGKPFLTDRERRGGFAVAVSLSDSLWTWNVSFTGLGRAEGNLRSSEAACRAWSGLLRAMSLFVVRACSRDGTPHLFGSRQALGKDRCRAGALGSRTAHRRQAHRGS
jgi:hypothetical protein